MLTTCSNTQYEGHQNQIYDFNIIIENLLSNWLKDKVCIMYVCQE